MKDKKYWKDFYTQEKVVEEPSLFAQYVNSFLGVRPYTILDAGCGNGRDSYYFAQQGHIVIGVDNCGYLPEDASNVIFREKDFATCEKLYKVIYSRFTFHSLSDEDQEVFLNSIQPNSLLAIETRSDKGMLDEKVHGEDHFRNFTNAASLKATLLDKGFHIFEIREDRGFAPYKTEDPICIRVLAKKWD